MAYDNAKSLTVLLAQHDFGAGAGAASFKLPKGKRGRIVDIGVTNITEGFTAVTTPAKVHVGTSADADAFATLNVGTPAATDTFNTVDDPDAIISADLPADTQIEVAYVASTGGTPAGIGQAFLVVEYY